MSVGFTGSTTEKFTVTNPLSYGSGTAFTYMFWIRRRSAWPNSSGIGKGANAVLAQFGGVYFADVVRDGTDAGTNVLSANLLASTSVWYFIAVTYDETNGIDIYEGDANGTVPAQATYDSQTVGTDPTSTDTGDLWIPNRGSGGSNAPPCVIQRFELVSRALTLPEIISRWAYQLPDKVTVLWYEVERVASITNLVEGPNGTPTGTLDLEPGPTIAPVPGNVFMFPTALNPEPSGGLNIPIAAYHYNHNMGSNL